MVPFAARYLPDMAGGDAGAGASPDHDAVTRPPGSNPTPRTITRGAWVAFLVVCVVWGSTYPTIRVMVDSIPPMTGAGGRFLLAGVLLAGLIAIRHGAARLKVTRKEALGCAAMGLLLPAIGNGLVTVAEQEVPSSLTALIVASVPLWIALFRSVTTDRPSRASVAGTVAGFLGLGLLLRADTGDVSLAWTSLVVIASASWAFGSTIQRRLRLPQDVAVTTSYEMVFGGGFLLLGGWIDGESLQTQEVTAGSAAAWLYLALAGSLLAFSCYSWLLQHSALSFVSTYAYINPIVAVLLGVAWLGESLPAMALLGGVVTLTGVMVVVRSEGRPKVVTRLGITPRDQQQSPDAEELAG